MDSDDSAALCCFVPTLGKSEVIRQRTIFPIFSLHYLFTYLISTGREQIIPILF